MLLLSFLISGIIVLFKCHRTAFHVNFWLISIGTAIAVFINFSDIYFYKAYGIRMNFMATEMFRNFDIVWPMLKNMYPIYSILTVFFLFTALGIYLHYKLVKKLKHNIGNDTIQTLKWFMASVLTFVVLSFLYYGPPLWYLSNFSGNSMLNQASMNGVYTLIKSIHQSSGKYKIPHDSYYSDDFALKRMRGIIKQKDEIFINDYYPTLRKDTTINKDNHNKKNIVIIIMESFNAGKVGSITNMKSYTPYFDTLSEKGVLFTNFFANGHRTHHALSGIIASFPSVMGTFLVRRKGVKNFHTLGNILYNHGYKTNFIYGGDMNFDNMDIFCKSGGFENIYDVSDFNEWRYKNEWGICDEDLFDFAENIIADQEQVSFTVILTLSNHAPFDIPCHFVKTKPFVKNVNKKDAAILYADYALGKFFKNISVKKNYKNTTYFIVGDHGEARNSDDHNFNIFHVPLLILNSQYLPEKKDMLCSQIDIAPTILDIVGFHKPYHFIGQKIFSNDYSPYFLAQNTTGAVFYGNKDYICKAKNLNDTRYYRLNSKHQLSETSISDSLKIEFEQDVFSMLQGLSFIFRKGRYIAK
jgi:phosphoglycerol transferase MdoB-like AlkP superfamily enzyme